MDSYRKFLTFEEGIDYDLEKESILKALHLTTHWFLTMKKQVKSYLR